MRIKRCTAGLAALVLFCLFAFSAPAEEAATLMVYGPYDPTQTRGEAAFAREHSEVHLTFSEADWSDAAIQKALATETPEADVLHLDSMTARALAEEGLLAPLDDWAFAAEWVHALPEDVRQAVTVNGHIYALPLARSGWCLAYDAQVLEAMGLTEADLPRSYPELFQFLTRWNREWAEVPYRPLTPWAMRSSLFYDVLQAWEDRAEYSGEELTFDTPPFLALMEDLNAMDLSRIEITDWAQLMAQGPMTLPCLFTACDPETALTTPRLVLWPLSVLPGETPALGSTMNCAVIAAGSPHQQEAAQLLQCYLEALSPVQRAALAPAMAQPVANPLYDQTIAGWEAEWQRLSALQAEGALDVSQTLALYRWQLEHQEAYRMLPSQAKADAWQKAAAGLFLRRNPALTPSQKTAMGFATVEERFLEGSLSPSQFVREMERKLQMAHMMQP